MQDYEIFKFDGPGVAMGMYNTEHAIRGFALSCFEYALEKQWCVPNTMAAWPEEHLTVKLPTVSSATMQWLHSLTSEGWFSKLRTFCSRWYSTLPFRLLPTGRCT